VIRGAVKLVIPTTEGGDLATVMSWADKYRTLRVGLAPASSGLRIHGFQIRV